MSQEDEVATLLLITFFPQLVLFLPRLFR